MLEIKFHVGNEIKFHVTNTKRQWNYSDFKINIPKIDDDLLTNCHLGIF